MNVQRDDAAVVDLRGDVEHDALEIRRELRRDGRLSGRASRELRRRDRQVRHEQLIESNLEDCFLIIQGGNSRTGENLHRPLGFEEIEQRGKVCRLQCEAEHRTGWVGGGKGSGGGDSSGRR